MGVSCSRESTAVDFSTPLLHEDGDRSPVEPSIHPSVFSGIVSSSQGGNRNTQPLLQSHNEAAELAQPNHDSETDDYSSEEPEVQAYNIALHEGEHDPIADVMFIYDLFAPCKTLDRLTIVQLGINPAHVHMHHFIANLETAHMNLCNAINEWPNSQHNRDDVDDIINKIGQQINEIQNKLIDLRAMFHKLFSLSDYLSALKRSPKEEAERNLIRGVEHIERDIMSSEEQLEVLRLSMSSAQQRAQ
jgi:Skp family chaperone for outer membrane proteins